MTRRLKVLASILVLATFVVLALFITVGQNSALTRAAGLILGGPEEPFNRGDAVTAPDYANDVYWAALPGSSDLADFVPEGVVNSGSSENLPVDVFFIHPTGLMSGPVWVSSMQATSKTEENTMWMMANQASAYNGCCRVYAPRYREASIFTYIRASEEERIKILRFAYEDVLAAFENFLEHRNQGRPFIIASHSQGSHHGAMLLRERIDSTPLVARMVAAYLIGGRLASDELNGLKDIAICDSPTQLHCAVHFDTMSEQAPVDPARSDNICVNPLSWRHDGGFAPKTQHRGAVIPSGYFQVDFLSDKFTGVKFSPLSEPISNHVSARCADGVLYVTDQSETEFGARAQQGHVYHLLDYPLFYINIRENAILRTQVYLQVQSNM